MNCFNSPLLTDAHRKGISGPNWLLICALLNDDVRLLEHYLVIAECLCNLFHPNTPIIIYKGPHFIRHFLIGANL